MARSAFTGGLFPTLLNHVGPLQGAWGHWGALMGLHGVSDCCQRPSRPTMSTVAVSVPYWGHTAAVCLLVVGMTRLRLPTTHPPPINSIRYITAVGKKLSQNPAVSARW